MQTEVAPPSTVNPPARIDTTIQVVPVAAGGWAIRVRGEKTESVHPSQGLAIARAWEMVGDATVAEIIVHGPGGNIHSSMLIQKYDPPEIYPDFLEDAEEEALRQAVMLRAPSLAEFRAMIERMPLSTIDYSDEDDELPC